MTNNTIRSEQPLIQRGLLFSQEEKDSILTEDNRINFAQSDKCTKDRVSWAVGYTHDQGNTSNNVGYTWASYMFSKYDMSGIEVPEKEFATSVYIKSQEVDPWKGQEGYGTSVLSPIALLKDYFNSVHWTQNVNDMSRYILEEGSMIVASTWTSEMNKVDPNGFVRHTGEYEGNHCWLVYGVDDVWETFFAINTFGQFFGKGGKFLVKFKDMQKILDEGFAFSTK